MRLIIVLLLWLGSDALSSWAQQFRVATWQVDHLPSVKARTTNSPADDQRFNDIATALSGTEADVIILYGISEAEAARTIAGMMKPRRYSVAHHTGFRHGGPKGPILGPAVAILSRREKMAAKNIAWDDTGRIDLPGGFGFGVFRHGQSAVCLYVAGLPGSLTNGVGSSDGKYFARKRNYAAQYLAHHASWLAGTYTNPVVATYLTGDFHVAPKGPVPDECAKTLEAAGFRALAPGPAADKSTTSITNSLELDRVQDPIFTRGVEFIASRQINRPAPERALIVCDITLKAPGTTAKVSPKPAPVRPLVPKKVSAPDPAPLPAPAPVQAAESPPRVVSSTVFPSVPTAAVMATSPASPASGLVSAMAWAGPGLPPVLAVADRSPSPARRFQPRWLWWLAAGCFGVGLFLSTRPWSVRRTIAGPVRRRANEAVYVDLQPCAETPPEAPEAQAPGDGVVLHESSTATGHADDVGWREGTAQVSPEAARERLLHQLKELMRERIVSWLMHQRQDLLESHERGADRVSNLQARLELIKCQFQERMLAQQQRIVELDAALRTKEKIILGLLRGKPPEENGE